MPVPTLSSGYGLDLPPRQRYTKSTAIKAAEIQELATSLRSIKDALRRVYDDDGELDSSHGGDPGEKQSQDTDAISRNDPGIVLQVGQGDESSKAVGSIRHNSTARAVSPGDSNASSSRGGSQSDTVTENDVASMSSISVSDLSYESDGDVGVAKSYNVQQRYEEVSKMLEKLNSQRQIEEMVAFRKDITKQLRNHADDMQEANALEMERGRQQIAMSDARERFDRDVQAVEANFFKQLNSFQVGMNESLEALRSRPSVKAKPKGFSFEGMKPFVPQRRRTAGAKAQTREVDQGETKQQTQPKSQASSLLGIIGGQQKEIAALGVRAALMDKQISAHKAAMEYLESLRDGKRARTSKVDEVTQELIISLMPDKDSTQDINASPALIVSETAAELKPGEEVQTSRDTVEHLKIKKAELEEGLENMNPTTRKRRLQAMAVVASTKSDVNIAGKNRGAVAGNDAFRAHSKEADVPSTFKIAPLRKKEPTHLTQAALQSKMEKLERVVEQAKIVLPNMDCERTELFECMSRATITSGWLPDFLVALVQKAQAEIGASRSNASAPPTLATRPQLALHLKPGTGKLARGQGTGGLPSTPIHSQTRHAQVIQDVSSPVVRCHPVPTNREEVSSASTDMTNVVGPTVQPKRATADSRQIGANGALQADVAQASSSSSSAAPHCCEQTSAVATNTSALQGPVIVSKAEVRSLSNYPSTAVTLPFSSTPAPLEALHEVLRTKIEGAERLECELVTDQLVEILGRPAPESIRDGDDLLGAIRSEREQLEVQLGDTIDANVALDRFEEEVRCEESVDSDGKINMKTNEDLPSLITGQRLKKVSAAESLRTRLNSCSVESFDSTNSLEEAAVETDPTQESAADTDTPSVLGCKRSRGKPRTVAALPGQLQCLVELQNEAVMLDSDIAHYDAMLLSLKMHGDLQPSDIAWLKNMRHEEENNEDSETKIAKGKLVDAMTQVKKLQCVVKKRRNSWCAEKEAAVVSLLEQRRGSARRENTSGIVVSEETAGLDQAFSSDCVKGPGDLASASSQPAFDDKADQPHQRSKVNSSVSRNKRLLRNLSQAEPQGRDRDLMSNLHVGQGAFRRRPSTVIGKLKTASHGRDASFSSSAYLAGGDALGAIGGHSKPTGVISGSFNQVQADGCRREGQSSMDRHHSLRDQNVLRSSSNFSNSTNLGIGNVLKGSRPVSVPHARGGSLLTGNRGRGGLKAADAQLPEPVLAIARCGSPTVKATELAPLQAAANNSADVVNTKHLFSKDPDIVSPNKSGCLKPLNPNGADGPVKTRISVGRRRDARQAWAAALGGGVPPHPGMLCAGTLVRTAPEPPRVSPFGKPPPPPKTAPAVERIRGTRFVRLS
eukprot:TRINITY_DN33644_c0_g1_i1.p1 TRINITY_DN33644_c0_g1~~TRINITY_DN33644_c0_g1_i1.p1  ORF type:complete len:1361 (-),score=220.83 TRINITY_DN33644_c0_g1_i1:173-4255(-)